MLGDYICTDIGRESVIIVRQADGSVRAFPECLSAPRQSTCVPKDLGKAEQFQCMYHHWTYDLEGKIARIFPILDSFPQGAAARREGCRRCRVAEWGHFVWFSLNPDVEPLEDVSRGDTRSILNPYHFERMAWKRDFHDRMGLQLENLGRCVSRELSCAGHPPSAAMVSRRCERADRLLRQAFALSGTLCHGQSACRHAINHTARDRPHDAASAGMDPAGYEGRVSPISATTSSRFIRRNARSSRARIFPS